MDGTVLIADDDRTIRTVLTQALTRAGCRVHCRLYEYHCDLDQQQHVQPVSGVR